MVYDIIVIGGSLGSLEALQQIMAKLPADLPAAVFVVIHTAPDRWSQLPEVLTEFGSMAASAAVHGERIQKGHVYVAPSDNHLSLQGEYVRVVRGPRENGHRPAVDVLFRSAARDFGRRVIGVVLSGQLDCGTAGILAIRARGGLTIVQDPNEATVPDMPRSALEHTPVDHMLPAAQIGILLAGLAGTEAPEHVHLWPVAFHDRDGSMVETDEGGLSRLRRRVRHPFSLDSLAAEEQHATENALWAAVRALQESESRTRRMAERSERSLAPRFLEQAEAMKQHSEVIRRMLLSDRILPRNEDEEAAGIGQAPGTG